MKPHEETWRYVEARLTGKGLIADDADPLRECYAEFDSQDRAKLAAQAPAMARLLMRVLEFPGAKHQIGMYAELSPEIKAALLAAGVLPC